MNSYLQQAFAIAHRMSFNYEPDQQATQIRARFREISQLIWKSQGAAPAKPDGLKDVIRGLKRNAEQNERDASHDYEARAVAAEQRRVIGILESLLGGKSKAA